MSHIENMHKIIECLTENAKFQLDKGVEQINAKEFGEVTDMIKDLNEAVYYAYITKAMKEAEEEEETMKKMGMSGEERRYYNRNRYSNGRYAPSGRGSRRGFDEMYEHMMPDYEREQYMRDMDKNNHGRMYYSGGGSMSSGGRSSSGGSSGSQSYYGGDSRDPREGRSGMSRKTYMETKEVNKGNTTQEKEAKMKELEKYMAELSTDLTEMIAGSTPEEKTMLKTKLQTISQKIV